MKRDADTNNLDQNGYRLRAACICIHKSRPNFTVLVSSSRNKYDNLGRPMMTIPGGRVESEESYQDAALRELEEEAGLKGHIIKLIGTFDNEARKHRTQVFLVEVVEELDEWMEKSFRTREWMSFEDANDKLSLYKAYQCDYITQLRCLDCSNVPTANSSGDLNS